MTRSRVVLTAMGTNQVLYYRFTTQGIQDNNGVTLFSAQSYAQALQDQENERRIAHEKHQKMIAEAPRLMVGKWSELGSFTAYKAKMENDDPGKYRARMEYEADGSWSQNGPQQYQTSGRWRIQGDTLRRSDSSNGDLTYILIDVNADNYVLKIGQELLNAERIKDR